MLRENIVFYNSYYNTDSLVYINLIIESYFYFKNFLRTDIQYCLKLYIFFQFQFTPDSFITLAVN